MNIFKPVHVEVSVTIISLFFSLQKYVSLQMESMAYIHYSSPLAGAEFSTVGKLRLQQSGPLPHKGSHTVYNVSFCECILSAVPL